jgi:hypothetical protein
MPAGLPEQRITTRVHPGSLTKDDCETRKLPVYLVSLLFHLLTYFLHVLAESAPGIATAERKAQGNKNHWAK